MITPQHVVEPQEDPGYGVGLDEEATLAEETERIGNQQDEEIFVLGLVKKRNPAPCLSKYAEIDKNEKGRRQPINLLD